MFSYCTLICIASAMSQKQATRVGRVFSGSAKIEEVARFTAQNIGIGQNNACPRVRYVLHNFVDVHALLVNVNPEGFGVFEAFLHSLRIELQYGIVEDLKKIQRGHFLKGKAS